MQTKPATDNVPLPHGFIALVAAVRDELKPIAKHLGLYSDPPWLSGQIQGLKLVAAVTGLGCRRALEVLEALLEEKPISAILHIGFAGALDPTLRAGQVVQVGRLINTRGQILDLARHGLVVPKPLVPPDSAVQQENPSDLAMISVDYLVATPQAKRQLRQQTGAALVDMESFAVVRSAMERNIPIAVIRAVSDTAKTAVPSSATNWVNPDGSHNLPRILQHLALRPWLIPATLRLAQHARQAARNLALAVETVLQALATTVAPIPPTHDPPVVLSTHQP